MSNKNWDKPAPQSGVRWLTLAELPFWLAVARCAWKQVAQVVWNRSCVTNWHKRKFPQDLVCTDDKVRAFCGQARIHSGIQSTSTILPKQNNKYSRHNTFKTFKTFNTYNNHFQDRSMFPSSTQVHSRRTWTQCLF